MPPYYSHLLLLVETRNPHIAVKFGYSLLICEQATNFNNLLVVLTSFLLL